MLHGHHHNNWPERYPFVNHEERRVNLSVEVLEYRPLSVDRLLTFLTVGRRFPDRAAARAACTDGD